MDYESRLRKMEEEMQDLSNKICRLEFSFLELQKSTQGKVKKEKPKSLGVEVWEAYAIAFRTQYGVEPVRNAKVNRQCQDIAQRLGAVDGPQVAAFYVKLKDQQFVRMNHPIGVLLMNCESIHSMWKRGSMTTASAARKVEKTEGNMDASRSYLERKHGKS